VVEDLVLAGVLAHEAQRWCWRAAVLEPPASVSEIVGIVLYAEVAEVEYARVDSAGEDDDFLQFGEACFDCLQGGFCGSLRVSCEK